MDTSSLLLIGWTIFVSGMVLGFTLATVLIFSLANKAVKKTQAIPCPHGHENWDDCPVCGH